MEYNSKMKQQKKLIVGNWKMNPRTILEARKIFSAVKLASVGLKKTDVVLCPPVVFLECLETSSKYALGAQNIHFEKDGAFTGEISAGMLASMKVKYVILGHSERREMGETDDFIAKKVVSAITAGLTVVLCVGEKVRDEECEYLKTLQAQIKASLSGVTKEMLKKLIIAYEPVWAIGVKATGVATPDVFLETSIFIRKVLAGIYDQPSAHAMKILYGGSADEKNAESFLKEGEANGLLVGRASVDAKKFINILKIAENC
jgi:triosephosphate isomerase